ncbi:MAG: hypothetical protein Q8911_10950, partial [Bacillota bacterium]|nr:hypothetical protein [Bacillota bacterium]
CLQELGAKVSVLEVDEVKIAALTQAGINAIYNRKENLASYQFIVDASPQGDFLDLSNLHSQAAIAAPGIPFGLTKAAHQVFKNRVIHDPLELGVATMLAMVMSED